MGKTQKIIDIINSDKIGGCYCQRDFIHIKGLRDNQLCRLAQSGVLKRIMTGIYYNPRYQNGQIIPPCETQVARAIASSVRTRAFPSGERSAYQLGLSDIEPKKGRYLVSLQNQKNFTREYNDTTLHFESTAISAFITTPDKIMSVVYALLSLKEDGIKKKYDLVIEKCSKIIKSNKDKQALIDVLKGNITPQWLQIVLTELIDIYEVHTEAKCSSST